MKISEPCVRKSRNRNAPLAPREAGADSISLSPRHMHIRGNGVQHSRGEGVGGGRGGAHVASSGVRGVPMPGKSTAARIP